jgi:hypothetical protein
MTAVRQPYNWILLKSLRISKILDLTAQLAVSSLIYSAFGLRNDKNRYQSIDTYVCQTGNDISSRIFRRDFNIILICSWHCGIQFSGATFEKHLVIKTQRNFQFSPRTVDLSAYDLIIMLFCCSLNEN